MISAFTNIFKIPELRQRILFTIGMLVIVRAGAAITIPGVNAHVLNEWFQSSMAKSASGGVAALFNIFAGGALEHCAVFSLGIMPYISASIMMQLLTAVVPRLNKLAREDGGRQKITQYTRYVTLGLCIFQGYLLAVSMQNPGSNPFLQGIESVTARLGPLVENPGLGFQIVATITLSAGTMFLMWIGDQITDRGIGNGTSLIITVGIVASLPGALVQVWNTFVPSSGAPSHVSPMVLVLMIAFLVLVVASVIALTQGQRKVSIQYAKRVVGRKVYGGQTQFLPLKVNSVGVMPLIFAQAILLFPSTILSMAFRNQEWAVVLSNALAVGVWHYVLTAALIFFFSDFWVAIQFQPTQIADDLKKYNGYIPGYRPGKPTADFLEYTLTRLTFAGALFLTIIAVIPETMITWLGVPRMTARFFGGTSLLIIVGVLLDTMRQVETYLIQRHYDGFLRKGRIRGRFERVAAGAWQGGEGKCPFVDVACVRGSGRSRCGRVHFREPEIVARGEEANCSFGTAASGKGTLAELVQNRFAIPATSTGAILRNSIGRHVQDAKEPCPNCGGKLEERDDDNIGALALRMTEFREKTVPVTDFYARRGILARVDANRSVESGFKDVSELIAA